MEPETTAPEAAELTLSEALANVLDQYLEAGIVTIEEAIGTLAVTQADYIDLARLPEDESEEADGMIFPDQPQAAS